MIMYLKWPYLFADFTFPLLDDKLPIEMRHELDILLLLVGADHLQIVAERLEFLLQAKGECQPAHVPGVPALPEIHHPLNGILLHHVLVAALRFPPVSSLHSFSISLVLFLGHNVAAEEHVAVSTVKDAHLVIG